MEFVDLQKSLFLLFEHPQLDLLCIVHVIWLADCLDV